MGKNSGLSPKPDPAPTPRADSTAPAPDSLRRADPAPRPKPAKPKAAHSPRKALLYGIIPGGGQIYNRKYWKLPLVYGGIGGLGYLFVDNRSRYQQYRKAYLHRVDGDPATNYVVPSDPNASESVLKLNRDNFRSRSELLGFGFVLFYGLTLADAFVDAHLKTFDISDDLSLDIQPQLRWDGLSSVPNAQLSFRFAWHPAPVRWPSVRF